ncbi:hypothetical protein M2337_000513 [Sphingobium sp. B2D3A]|uniref:hypothetical protein n=1 Tax=unclassified Sphingobium TaxID=2611147 RepID=UPI0022255638|nr:MULTISPECIES: hypothetical protein [unclassified Sphingobium]MCW2336280.1 hypothetical protein [Sphingobium sp. B2D3A]MCW2386035.1 hypothetical protein [Sphingobium sp. B2D3D]
MTGEANKQDALKLPVSRLEPRKVGGGRPANGLLWQLHGPVPSSIVVDWDGVAYATYLDGTHAMNSFAIPRGRLLEGLLISSEHLEFIVDVSSRYDPVRYTGPAGVLMLKAGKLHLMTVDFSDGFKDIKAIPLWGDYPSAGEEGAAAFSRWKLVTRNGEQEITLWEFSGLQPGAA